MQRLHDPVIPIDPVIPVIPVEPVIPVVPVIPIEPVIPVEPVEPVIPVIPIDPVIPIEPIMTLEHPRHLLARHGLRPKKDWGQNFLGDERVLSDIAAACAFLPLALLALYSGKKSGERAPRWTTNKWMFYVIYPAHLVVIGVMFWRFGWLK